MFLMRKRKKLELFSMKGLTLENKSSKIIPKGGENMMQFSLRELRARNNWTQQETATKLGISTQTYNSWEADFGRVKIRSAAKVAELFGVKLDEIKFI